MGAAFAYGPSRDAMSSGISVPRSGSPGIFVAQATVIDPVAIVVSPRRIVHVY